MAIASSRVRLRPTNPGAALAARSLERRLPGDGKVFPIEVVRDNLRFFANHALRSPVAPLRKQAAEFVDHFVGVEADSLCVVSHIAAREYPLGPAGEVVVFQGLPQLDAELGLRCQLLECDASTFAGCPENRTESLLLESQVIFFKAKSLPTKSRAEMDVFEGIASEIALS